MERVVIPDSTDLERQFIGIPHDVTITESKDIAMALENGKVESEVVGMDKTTGKCRVCGEKLEGRRDAERHAEEGHIDESRQMVEQFAGVGIHGFNFNGFAGHGSSIRFSHQTLGVDVMLSSMEWHGEQQGISIGIKGKPNTEFERFTGTPQKRVNADSGMSYAEVITELRDFIEDRFKHIPEDDNQ